METPRNRSRKLQGGFWNNDMASETETTKSGRRVHRSRSYRKARRDSSRKKWKSRAIKAALTAAALGVGYAGYKNRGRIAEGYNNGVSGLQTRYNNGVSGLQTRYNDGVSGLQTGYNYGMQGLRTGAEKFRRATTTAA